MPCHALREARYLTKSAKKRSEKKIKKKAFELSYSGQRRLLCVVIKNDNDDESIVTFYHVLLILLFSRIYTFVASLACLGWDFFSPMFFLLQNENKNTTSIHFLWVEKKKRAHAYGQKSRIKIKL